MTFTSAQKKKKVIAAMSGGVDSSVAAALLHEAGFEVIGVTLRLLDRAEAGFGCCGSPEDIAIAKRSAERIGIPHYVLDHSQSFQENVIDYFFDSYVNGETPNPCLACNRFIKFERLLQFSNSLQGDFLATGHYAKIAPANGGQKYRLMRASDPTKDQSYVLYMLDQDALNRVLFPLGDLPKSKTREIARSLGLPNADKPDSQDICFIPNGNYREFLKKESVKHPSSKGIEPGPILDHFGKTLGQHKGLAFYTVGQREGLGISAGRPLYVTKIDPKSNTVVVGATDETLIQEISVGDVRWVSGEIPGAPFQALAQIRYRQAPIPVHVQPASSGKIILQFDNPQRGASPGQAAVLYQHPDFGDPNEVLGGGIIHTSSP